MKLKASVESEYLREFIDGLLRETYLRVKLLDALSLPEMALGAAEKRPLDETIKALEVMCTHTRMVPPVPPNFFHIESILYSPIYPFYQFCSGHISKL